MTLAANSPVSTHTGNGVTTSFLYDFKIFLASDLVVEVNDVVQPTGYSVTNVGGSNGNAVFTVAPVLGARITLYRAVSFSRSVDYQYQGDLPSDVINKDIDRVWMAAQELDAQVERSFRLPLAVSGVDVTLPTPVANRSVKWSSDGLSLVNTNFDPDDAGDAAAIAQQAALDAQADADAAAASAAAAATFNPALYARKDIAQAIANIFTFAMSPLIPTPTAGDNSTKAASTAYVNNAVQFSSAAENAAGAIENKIVDPLGIREAFNATGSAPVYACRAWVNFNGTGTVAIRASGNVSSITDNGVGDYTINFATALPDANYSAVLTSLALNGNNHDFAVQIAGVAASGPTTMTASALRIMSGTVTAAGNADAVTICASIFR